MADCKPPCVRIRYNSILDSVYRKAYASDPAFAGIPYPSEEEIETRIERYKTEWKGYGENLLRGMCEKLGLHFCQNVIDVYIVGRAIPVSDPMVLGIRHKPDYFVDVLTHELLHRLLTDYAEEGDLWEIVDEWYLTEWRIVKAHILVHAVHAHLFLDVLKQPKRLVREIEASETLPPGYKRAWDLVFAEGFKAYNKLIEKFKGDKRWPQPKKPNEPCQHDILPRRPVHCSRPEEAV